jgi:hypothetical protein
MQLQQGFMQTKYYNCEQSGVRLAFRVAAINPAGEGEFSDVRFVRVQ